MVKKIFFRHKMIFQANFSGGTLHYSFSVGHLNDRCEKCSSKSGRYGLKRTIASHHVLFSFLRVVDKQGLIPDIIPKAEYNMPN